MKNFLGHRLNADETQKEIHQEGRKVGIEFGILLALSFQPSCFPDSYPCSVCVPSMAQTLFGLI